MCKYTASSSWILSTPRRCDVYSKMLTAVIYTYLRQTVLRISHNTLITFHKSNREEPEILQHSIIQGIWSLDDWSKILTPFSTTDIMFSYEKSQNTVLCDWYSLLLNFIHFLSFQKQPLINIPWKEHQL